MPTGVYKRTKAPWIKGRHHSQNTKDKISETKKKNPICYWLDKVRSESTKDKIRESLIGRFTGKENPMYGKSGELSPVYGTHHTKEIKDKIAESNRGKTISEKARERMSKAKIGKRLSPNTEFKKGQIPWNKGKRGVMPEPWNKGMGISSSLYERIRKSFEYRQWRSDVFARDNFTCQECGTSKSGVLNAHHKKAFNDILILNDIRTFEQALNCEELWNINNGITYCRECHKAQKMLLGVG